MYLPLHGWKELVRELMRRCLARLDTRHRTVIQGVIHFAADWTPVIAPVVDDPDDVTSNLFTAMMPVLLTAIEEHETRTGELRG